MPEGEIGDEVLEEGCYYLSQLGLASETIATHFELSPAEVQKLVSSYSAKLKAGEVVPDPFDRVFWEDVKKEAEGDVKLTLVSERGFHHAWKSEVAKFDGRALMAIFEASKDFLSADPNQKFLDYPAPKGYDPLALDREVRKSVEVVGKLLEERWKALSEESSRKDERTQG